MKFALVFPGQGSQALGMMQAYGDEPVIRSTFAEASAALGRDLWALATDGPAEALNQTVNTQPLMLTAGIAVYRLWLEKGGREPALLAGHSLGEYSALVAAGVLRFADAVPLVELRASAMQEAVPAGQGAMAAVLGLDAAAKSCRCAPGEAQGKIVEAVNFNAPEQNRNGGHAAAGRGSGLARDRGPSAQVAAVSATFHSLMKPRRALARSPGRTRTAAPRIPVINKR